MRFSKIICLFLLTFFVRLPLFAQSYYFRHYQVENGLSNNTVLCSLQDQMGFLWFGTKDGLNRFDGYSFRTYRKIPGKPESLGNNNVHSLCEDKDKVLWVGTDNGLYQYDQRTEEFHLVPATADRYIDKLTEGDNGNLWFISNFELCRYSQRTKKLDVYSHEHYFVATSVCSSPDGMIWATTQSGQLEKFNSEQNAFSGFDLFAHSRPSASRWIEDLYYSKDGYLVAGTGDTEIKVIDPVHGTYTDFTLPQSGQKNLYIRSIQQTAPDEFWLGTESGIFIYNLKTKACQHLQKDYSNSYTINDNAVYTFCRDREGGVWIGTYFGGLNYLPTQRTPFTKYYPKKGENSLSGNVVREIKKDQYGNLWIGTEDAGLNKIDSSGTITHFEPDNTSGSISFFNIHGLLVTGNELWIGTLQHGLDVMSIRTGKVIRHYDAGPSSGLTHNFIYCIYQNPSGQIFVATPHGISTYNKEINKFEQFNGLPWGSWYTSILQDEKGIIWGGTFGNGVHSYNPATGKTAAFHYNATDANSISSERVNAVFEDHNQAIWFATEDGLCKWNEQTQNFTRYGTSNGFPSNFIFCIQEDNQQNLWISTTKGLVRFNPSSGNSQVYTVSNGLIGDQFNYNSAFKDSDGRLYFGSTKGLVSFRPEEFNPTAFVAPVYLTGFQVNTQESSVNEEQSPLKQSIIITDKITLSHNQSSFSIDFAALTYSAPEAMQYAYRLEGLTKDWINLKKNRRVDFIELAPGTYRFRVRAASGDGTRSMEAKLTIVVLPPWWASTGAYVVYSLLILLSIYMLMRYYHKRMEQRAKRRIELLKIAKEKELLEMELAKEKELLEAKIEFFTNVAHEIKTPLTLIKVPLMKIMKKASGISDLENSLKIMSRNTNRLIELTHQLLDFRQTEINKFHLSLERAEISGLVAETSAGFISLAEQNNITMTVNLPPTPFYAFVDVDAFSKIIYNLFSNAVKYAESKVCVDLLPLHRDNNSFTIRVKNDGSLIPDELKEKIFEPFYRIRKIDNQTGTGIGLALALSLTQLHKGTLSLEPPENGMNVFSLTLLINTDSKTALQSKTANAHASND